MASNLDFHVGAQLDAYSESDEGWIIGTIIETKQNQIKINYLGYTNRWDMWFDKTSQHLAPLNTHTLPIHHLSPPPKNRYSAARPIIHKDPLYI